MKKFIQVLFALMLLVQQAKSQGTNCASSDPFCTGTTYTFPNSTSTPDLGAINCCSTTPNPAWYFMEIDAPGNMTITIQQTSTSGSDIDVDFVLFGPYSSLTAACVSIPGGPVEDCSYSTAAIENADITGAVVGEIYVLLLTNFSDVPGTIEFSQTSGTASADCSLLCGVTGFTAVPSACNPATNTYSVTGTLSITSPPTTGTLTITNSCGGSQTFPAGATSYTYNFTGLTATGAGCTISATWSADPTCNTNATYTAPAPCTTTSCLITSMNANIGAPTGCSPGPGVYAVTGSISFTGAPTTGTLTVNACGQTQTFTAPFTSPIAYNVTNIPATGAACNVTATFSAAPACTQTIPYTAPSCLCNMDSLVVNIGACIPATDSYDVDVHLVFTAPPTTGTLNVTVCGVTQTISPPFVSPLDLTFTGLPADGSNCTVNAAFSASPGCSNSLSFTAPTTCACPADAGTFTVNMTGSGTTNYILCENDQIDITSNGDMTYPLDLSDPVTPYNPGIWVLIYSCPPTPGMDILADPCFLGVSPFTDDNGNMSDINDLALINSFPAGTFTNNTIYFVPITMYDVGSGIYSLYPPPNLCFDLGTPVPVTYLPPITATGVPNCAAGSVTVTVSGGHPEIFGTNFTASGLTPATASFVNTSCGDGGTIVINGLNNGDMYSFTITDVNGCPHTFSGGPFVGPATATIGPAGPFCATDPATVIPTSIPGGTWSASCGACINATTGSFNPATAGLGTYTVTYTPTGCAVPSTINVTVGNIVINSVVAVDVSCNGGSDGSLTINCAAATQFSIDGGATFQTSNVFTGLPAGTYNIEVQSPGGCVATTTATINQPAPLTVTPGLVQNETCAGSCDGVIVAAGGGGTAPYTYAWTGPASGTTPVLSALCTGTYTITLTDDNGCTVTGTQAVSGPIAVTITSVTPTNLTCNGVNTGTITIVASAGVTGYSINGGATFQTTGSFTGLAAGTYNIEVQDINGCSATTTTTITQPAALTATSSPDVTICIGQSTTISVTPGGGTPAYTFAWNDPTSATTSSVSVNPTTTTVYNVVVSDANGCGPINESVVVTVNPPLNVVALTSTTICPGATANISAVANGGNGGPYTYTWTNDQDGTVLVGQNQTVSPSVTTTYTVTVTDGCGTPSATSSVTIGLYTLPVVTFVVDTNQGCTPVVVNFSNTMNPADVGTCTWDFGDGTTGSSCNMTHVYSTPGCYDVTLTVVTTTGCTVNGVVDSMVCVFPIPQAEFTFTPNPGGIFFPDIEFTNLTVGGNTYTWDFASLGTSTAINPAFTFPNDTGGVYQVCLSTVNTAGCFDSTCHNVIIQDEFIIYVPNAFTADGDGINDIFLPVLQGEDPNSYELMIFDRWGELIFVSNNKLIGWDGTHKNIKCKEDVYVWKVKAKRKSNSEKVQYIGHVTLLR